MRPIPLGHQATVEVVVTPEMTVDFEELGPVHPVYATYWLARHMEEASRKLLLPFLEPGEDGIGHALSVRHLAPALPGMRVRVVAEHVGTAGNRVEARCRAYHELGDLIGEGATTQVVLPVAALEARLARLRSRWASAARREGDADGHEDGEGGRG